MARASYRGIGEATLFARAAVRYWLGVFPQVCRELAHWRRRAAEIPDDALRCAALDSLLIKRGDLEGAAAFAVFAPPRTRRGLVRAIVAWEIAFDYLDTIGEMPNPDPIANGRALNQALLIAFSPGTPHPNYYALHMREGDGGYLPDLVDTCRRAILLLPAFGLIAEAAHRALERIVAYQSLNHGDAYGSHAAFAEWARSLPSSDIPLHWWELAAAGGSQLTVLALMTAAADARLDARLDARRAAALVDAYFPWIAALSTLLDSLVDQVRDNAEGHANLIDYYESPAEVAERFSLIAAQATGRVRRLPDADHHALLLVAMAAFFHTQSASRQARRATHAVLDAMGAASSPALCVFKLRYFSRSRRYGGIPADLQQTPGQS